MTQVSVAASVRAFGNAHQVRHLRDRPVLDVHQLPDLPVRAALGSEDRHRAFQVGTGQRGVRRVPRVPLVRRDHRGQHQLGRAAAAQEQRGLAPGDPPDPAGRRAVGTVAARPPPHGQEGLLQHVLGIRGGQHRPQPGRQPWRVPDEQLPQRGVVTARHGRDQLSVVHRFSIAFRRHPVHGSGKFPATPS